MNAPQTGTPAPTETPCMEVRDLERWLGAEESRVHVLRGVSLSLEPGSVHAIVGPSGCGKSSLLYLLGLLDSPDGGEILLGGESALALADEDASARRTAKLGFVFQFHFLLEDFTAEENVMIPMRRLGLLTETEMRDRARELLGEVGLREKATRPSRHLSGGEQQRVAIARSLANDPLVLLADEPTGNLDSANSERVFSLLTRLVHEQRKALLLVTHNPLIAERCDWVHEMKDGLIVRTTRNARG